jgi:hypothetical protein
MVMVTTTQKAKSATTSAASKKHARELEIARKLANLLGVMPFEFMLNLQSELIAKLSINGNADASFEIITEAPLDKITKGEQRRLDILVPLAPKIELVDSIKVYEEIIFELKLFKEDLVQVNGYAEIRRNAIVVSISKFPAPITATIPALPNVIQLTWEDVFWGLFDFLDVGAQKRLVGAKGIAGNSNLSISPLQQPLGNVAELYLEDFCKSIKRSVKTNFQRVIVVTGELANETTKDHIYFFPARWDGEFDYLAVVLKGKIEYYGKVVKRLNPAIYVSNSPSNIGDVVDASNKTAILTTDESAALKNNVAKYTHSGDGIIVWLESLQNANDPVVSVMRDNNKNKYQRKGAITQSHRYFDNPQDFVDHFQAMKSV